MSEPQCVNRMTEPPIVGRWYMVPAIFYRRFSRQGPELWWPVLGPRHNDVEFFDFKWEHFHFDQRFLTVRHLNVIDRDPEYALKRSFYQPLQGNETGKRLPMPTLHRMQCRRVMPEYPWSGQLAIENINLHYEGRMAKRGKRGWICPHRQTALGTMVPDAAGVITCPLHGLRIDAKTGRCAGSAPSRRKRNRNDEQR